VVILLPYYSHLNIRSVKDLYLSKKNILMNLLRNLNVHKGFFYLIIFCSLSLIIFQSVKNGPAQADDKDRTGGPIANGKDCGGCHSGGNFSSTLNITVKNSGGFSITEYVPGDTYTLEALVTGAMGAWVRLMDSREWR